MKERFFLTVVVCLLLAGLAQAQRVLQINETETQALFQNNQLQINLVLENSSPSRNFPVKIKLEILDAADKVLAKTEINEKFSGRKQTFQTTFGFNEKQYTDDLLWHRLRYSVSPLENPSNKTSGLVSLSEIMPELFELAISAPKNITSGIKFGSHVLALHPLTKKPVKDVQISGKLTLELNIDSGEDELEIFAKGKTNKQGFVTLDFEIPADAKLEYGEYNGELEITGEKNGITREADEDLDVPFENFFYLHTDKPIYQPEQKLFARGLYLNSLKKPLADTEFEIEIMDEEDETVFSQTVKTSRFGIADIEWQIPKNIKLGNYKIQIEDEDEETVTLAEIKITRYDLPNFTVNAKPDRTFYLPSQTKAEISVNAKYLFGKPVEKGRVKVVQENSRKWNYGEQKYEIEESDVFEGETDAEGNFVAELDLTKAHAELQRDNWKRFEDLQFTAYFTDPTTNRTEQKRFDLRISKEAIHIYFIHYASDINPKLPFQFYVSTFYADGSPANCNVKIKGNYEKVKSDETLAETKTNSLGVSKLEIRIPEKPFSSAENEFNLEIYASDKEGNKGTLADNIYVDGTKKQVRIQTNKTIYLPKESIEAEVFSTDAEDIVFVDVLKNSSLIYSERLKLKDGDKFMRIPFRPEFVGELTLVVYSQYQKNSYDPIYFAKTIIYPSPNDLNLNIRSLKASYRPGEEATLDFKVRDGKGKPIETAIGIVVLDKAIEERAEAEQVRDNYTNIRKLLGVDDTFGNITRRDLHNLDLTKQIREDMQIAAEFLLVNKNYRPQFFASDSYKDDFQRIYAKYFKEKLAPLEKVLTDQHEKTGEYPKDEKSLRQILAANSFDLENLKDAWGTNYLTEFKPDRNLITLTLKTASADKKFGTADDFIVGQISFSRFTKLQKDLNDILNENKTKTGKFPETTEELKAIWKNGGFDFDAFQDDWKRPFYLTKTFYTVDAQKEKIEKVGNLDGVEQETVKSYPVKQEIIVFRIKSAGKDGIEGQYDDFEVATFASILSEEVFLDEKRSASISKTPTLNSSGAIGGTIFDQAGAVIPGSKVTAENQNTLKEYSGTTNDEGYYLIQNLPSGKYRIRADSQYFQPSTVSNVVISSMILINLDFYLDVGSVSAVVEVTSGAAATIDSSSSMVVTTVTADSEVSITGNLNGIDKQTLSTPRVREYFPETLLWQPDLITDKKGRAEVKFKLADSLTTWKFYAVGSTETGEIGFVEKELQTFQPFFAELDPPKVLTEGDEISLPVPVRNYTDKRQKVSVSMAENSWSTLLNGSSQEIEVEPNKTQNAIFNFRAVSPVESGKQKVTAIANKEGDAIEKTLKVRPNGMEVVKTDSQLFRESAVFDVNFPANSFTNTRSAELKIYPNMLAHVAESVEGLLKRPYGCGEQTTSSTYPNLMILKIEKDLGKKVDPKVKQQAENYLREGYERLLNYQTDSGGFSYWGKSSPPNVALTAYVLRFLNDAEGFTAVDENVIANARKWLLKEQAEDGSWENNFEKTAYVARTLSIGAGDDAAKKSALMRAFEFLKKTSDSVKDTDDLANFALASININETKTAQAIAAKLKNLAQPDQESLYWDTSHTPFYGWGKSAKIESTALALQTFLLLNDKDQFQNEISRGLAFLIKNKDKYGVWYSTQTTVNTLDSLILLQKLTASSNQNAKLEIFINGVKIKEIATDANSLSNPVFVDISENLSDINRIEIKNSGGGVANLSMGQIVSTHFVNWNEAKDAESRYFDMKVDYDKPQAEIGEDITCAVQINRKGYNGRGMILAEIGLPPGADVDRASLENIKSEKGGISNYDVLPDKIVIYAWAENRPLNFSFKFKQRYGINAQTAPSNVYDYYNPEAKATVAPMRFDIR